MASIGHHLRTGDWLTLARLRSYAVIFLAVYVVAAVLWIALADGLIDRNGKPLGTDFSNVYAAGTLAHAGKADAAYDWETEQAAETTIFGRPVPFYGWHYPPQFLIVASVLAVVPYAYALVAWMAVTPPAYLLALRALVTRNVHWCWVRAPPPPETGLVPRLPTAILATGIVQLGVLTFAVGLVVDAIARSRREAKRMRNLDLHSVADKA
jgi:alpha-1,2-mannosyltransferase